MPPAARLGDMHTCPMVDWFKPHVGGPVLLPCTPQVLIGFQPAARAGDKAICVGPPDSIAMGSPTVLIGNQMAARLGDPTVHGGIIVQGMMTVLIGEVGGPSISPPPRSPALAKLVAAANKLPKKKDTAGAAQALAALKEVQQLGDFYLALAKANQLASEAVVHAKVGAAVDKLKNDPIGAVADASKALVGKTIKAVKSAKKRTANRAARNVAVRVIKAVLAAKDGIPFINNSEPDSPAGLPGNKKK